MNKENCALKLVDEIILHRDMYSENVRRGADLGDLGVKWISRLEQSLNRGCIASLWQWATLLNCELVRGLHVEK